MRGAFMSVYLLRSCLLFSFSSRLSYVPPAQDRSDWFKPLEGLWLVDGCEVSVDWSEMNFHVADFFGIDEINEWEIFEEIFAEFSEEGFMRFDIDGVLFEGCPGDFEVLLTFQLHRVLQPVVKCLLLLRVLVEFFDHSLLEVLVVDDKSHERTAEVLEYVLVSTLTVLRSLRLSVCLLIAAHRVAY